MHKNEIERIESWRWFGVGESRLLARGVAFLQKTIIVFIFLNYFKLFAEKTKNALLAIRLGFWKLFLIKTHFWLAFFFQNGLYWCLKKEKNIWPVKNGCRKIVPKIISTNSLPPHTHIVSTPADSEFSMLCFLAIFVDFFRE